MRGKPLNDHVTRVALATIFALCTALYPAPGGAARAAEALTEHVVLISVDGLLPEYTIRPEDFGVRLPNIQALRDRGSWAEGVIGQYPSLTYPSHTSIVTGVRPARHGIFQNTGFEPTGGGAWFFESEAIRVPTLWQLAKAASLRTAGVSWPVTVGADIDILYPETHQNPPDTSWLELARRESTPGLIDAVVAEMGGFGERDNLDPVKRDQFATAVATHIITNHQPNFLAIHLVQTDYAQHATGKHTIESLHAFSRVDGHIGEIIRAVSAAGLLERTTFVVTGDHGFYRVHSEFQPNVVLRRAGLLSTDEAGTINKWQAVAHRASIRIADAADSALAQRVERLFRELADGQYRGLLEVIGRKQLDQLGADPEALLYLEPAEGFAISQGFVEDSFLVGTQRRGSHGYLPTRPAMHTGLVLSGSGIQQGVAFPIARQVDIAPTIARLLGFEMANTEGTAMAGALEEPSSSD